MNDSYAQWVNSSGISNGFNYMTSLFTAAGGGAALKAIAGGVSAPPVAAAAAAGSLISGGKGMIQSKIQEAQAKARPDIAVGSMGSGGSIFALTQLRANLTRIGYDPKSAKAADDFMSIYGYTTNDVVMPNLNTRNLWNYVETSDCNVQGDVAYNVREALNNIFNSGVFIWHTNAIGTFNIGGNG